LLGLDRESCARARGEGKSRPGGNSAFEEVEKDEQPWSHSCVHRLQAIFEEEIISQDLYGAKRSGKNEKSRKCFRVVE
jgi:hypothetical protein